MESYFPSAFSPLLSFFPIITFCDELINYCEAARTAHSPCNVQSGESISSLIGLDEKLFIKHLSGWKSSLPTGFRIIPVPPSPSLPNRLLPTPPSAPPACLGRKGRETGSRITLHFLAFGFTSYTAAQQAFIVTCTRVRF